jgi:ribosome-binding ATPase YchF (GTP1/OBG family)
MQCVVTCYTEHWQHTFIVKGENMCCVFSSKVPAFLNVVDIAGLVKGASEGQGLGNAFLSHIKACDAIFHLCRECLITFD